MDRVGSVLSEIYTPFSPRSPAVYGVYDSYVPVSR